MFCKNCGAKLNEDAMFCTSCGAKVEINPTQELPETSAQTQTESVEEANTEPLETIGAVTETVEKVSGELPKAEKSENTIIQEAANPVNPVNPMSQGSIPNQGNMVNGAMGNPGMNPGMNQGMNQGFPNQGYPNPGMQQGNQGRPMQPNQMPPNYQQQNRPVKAKKKVSPKVIILCVVAVVLIAVVASLGYLVKNVGNPENVAKEYFKAISDQDYEKAYGMVEFPESEYLTEDNFVTAMKSKEKGEIGSYSVFEGSSAYSGNQGSDTKIYDMSYYTKGTSDQGYYEVQLVKGDKKKFGIFNTWNVVPVEMVISEYTILAPIDAKVYVGDIEVKAMTGSNELVSYPESQAAFVINNIFANTYTITIKANGRTDLSESVEIYDGGSYYGDSLELDPKKEEELVTISQSILGDMYSGIKNKLTADKITSIASLKDNTFYTDEYNEYNITGYEDYISFAYSKLAVENVEKSYTSSEFVDGKYQVVISLDYDVAYDVSYTYGTTTGSDANSDYGYAYFTFELSGDTWTLVKISE